MTTRTDVYKAINSERDYQDSIWQSQENPGTANPLTIGEFLLLLEEYVGQARNSWAKEKKPENNALNIVRKISAIGVNCLEQHGAPQRKGFEQ